MGSVLSNPPPPQQVLLTPGAHTLHIDATANDPIDHFDAGYRFDPTFAPARAPRRWRTRWPLRSRPSRRSAATARCWWSRAGSTHPSQLHRVRGNARRRGLGPVDRDPRGPRILPSCHPLSLRGRGRVAGVAAAPRRHPRDPQGLASRRHDAPLDGTRSGRRFCSRGCTVKPHWKKI